MLSKPPSAVEPPPLAFRPPLSRVLSLLENIWAWISISWDSNICVVVTENLVLLFERKSTGKLVWLTWNKQLDSANTKHEDIGHPPPGLYISGLYVSGLYIYINFTTNYCKPCSPIVPFGLASIWESTRSLYVLEISFEMLFISTWSIQLINRRA